MIQEPAISINGVPLTEAQAATVRNAIEYMAAFLVDNGLGDDAHGRTMVVSYMANIEQIRRLMYPR